LTLQWNPMGEPLYKGNLLLGEHLGDLWGLGGPLGNIFEHLWGESVGGLRDVSLCQPLGDFWEDLGRNIWWNVWGEIWVNLWGNIEGNLCENLWGNLWVLSLQSQRHRASQYRHHIRRLLIPIVSDVGRNQGICIVSLPKAPQLWNWHPTYSGNSSSINSRSIPIAPGYVIAHAHSAGM
jgi:hypothetical protein